MAMSVLTLLLMVVAVSGIALPVPRLPTLGLPALQGDEKRSDAGPSREITAAEEAVGACRATCIEQTLAWPPTNDACLGTKDCLDCWEMCGHLYSDEYRWRPLCTDDEQCSQGFGCTTACKYSFSSVSMPDVMPMAFSETPITSEKSANQLVISWEAPVPLIKVPDAGPYFFIYTLLFRDDSNPQWTQVITTTEHYTTIDGPHASFHGLQFLLIASSPLGTVARDQPPYPGAAAADNKAVISTTQLPHRRPENVGKPTPAPAASNNGPAPFDQFPAKISGLSVRAIVAPDGGLEAEITWSQDIAPGQQFLYNIKWTLVTCNVDMHMPVCHIKGQERFTIQVKATPKKDMRLILTGLVYNSQYMLDVGFQGADTSDQTVFYTPPCPTVDATYKTCISVHGSESVSEKPVVTDQPETPKPTVQTTTSPKTSTTGSSATADRLPNILPLLLKSRGKLSGALPFDVILLSTGVTFGSFIIIAILYVVYRRCSRRQDPVAEFTKVLLGSGPGSLSSSLHQLHLHNALSQNALNMSQVTPNGSMATPTHQMSSPFLSSPSMLSPQLQQYQQNLLQSMQPVKQQWNSMEAIYNTPTGRTVRGAAATHGFSPLMMRAVQQSKSQVLKQDTVVNMDNAGSPRVTTQTIPYHPEGTPTSRSLENLSQPPMDIKRSVSYTDISPNSQQKTARRQINFSHVQAPSPAHLHPMIVVSPPECQDYTDAECTDDSVGSNHRFLQTVYEEGWVEHERDAGELQDSEEEGRFGEVMEWDYNVMSSPFRNRVESM